jgi:DNA polymerase III delta prime subunit
MENYMSDDFLWVEKYRPKTVDDCILTDKLKATFKEFVNQKNVPNLLLSGSAGCGKTTIAKAMLEELGCDYIVINGSLNANMDALRTQLSNYASAVSFSGTRKYVILDEADYLSAGGNSPVQPALRNFMEEYSSNCGFILTCNFKNRIIEPLHSRCSVVDFKINKADLPSLSVQFLKRACMILDTEGVAYDKKVVAAVISKHSPDWRRVLNELQRYSATGKIDEGILVNFSDEAYKKLIGHLKQKDFGAARKWIAENIDIDTDMLFKSLYDNCYDLLVPQSIPDLILILAKYQYQAAFVANKEINLAAAIIEVLANCSFK